MRRPIIAFIPARGGSKSIPGKNIKKLNGQALICWALQELTKSQMVNEIYVSTDSLEISEVVSAFDQTVKIFNRNPENALDESSTEEALCEFIGANGFKEEIVLLVQATSPFTLASHFDEALKYFIDSEFDSLLSVTLNKRFFWNQDNKPVNYSYTARPRRQDFQGLAMENGAFYISSANDILKNNNRISGKIGMYKMPEFTGIEIDEEDDWLIAELLMKKFNYSPKNQTKNNDIRILITDVDGVLTDAGMYYSEKGDELKKFNTYDGMAFKILRENGIKIGVITSENTKIVSNRAKKLQVDYLYQGRSSGTKLEAIQEICVTEGVSINQVVYVGDDINCYEALTNVGVPVCPSSAYKKIKNIPGIIIIDKAGGEGVIRATVDLLFDF